jgi:transcriptional regulator with XRE-family HTH domain
MTFADKLQSLRKTKKLSQEDLAEKCGVTRQSVSKWETGLGYPETEKLLILCDVLNVNLDYLLRDINDTPHEDKMQEHLFSFGSYIGKWLQIFVKDKEFNGFYCVGLISIKNTQLLLMDDKCKAILMDMTSVGTISELTNEKQIKKLPIIPADKIIPNISDYFIDKKCDIRLKQKQPLLGFNKPGGFYSVLVISISNKVVIAKDMKGNKHTIQMSDVLFIKERQ